MVSQQAQFMQKDPRAAVEGLPTSVRVTRISVPVEQTKPELAFQIFDGRKETVEWVRRNLAAAA